MKPVESWLDNCSCNGIECTVVKEIGNRVMYCTKSDNSHMVFYHVWDKGEDWIYCGPDLGAALRYVGE